MKCWRVMAALACVAVVSGCATTKSFQLQSLETKNLRVLYTPKEAYLVPYAARSFENALAFHEKTFRWTPWGRTTVLLTDLSDHGNGGTGVSPFNLVTVSIAPITKTLEVTPGSDRLFMVANHELTHAAVNDGWNQRDADWRHFLGGKPPTSAKHPMSILYDYLATPHMSAPRWYQEGIAVFMETWMSGGIGRAQGAYDEMVWRSMVRDHAHFFSPLGLVSLDVSVDFQHMTNAYLYGTRFITYLALHYSPQQVLDWYIRSKGSKAWYADQFQQVFHIPLHQAWNNWIAWEHTFQKGNLEKIRQFPLTPTRPLAHRALGSVSRTYLDMHNHTLIGAFLYPGKLAYVGVLSLKDGSIRHLVNIKGPLEYRVTYSAWDPATQTFFYTDNNMAHSDLMAVNVRTGKSRRLLKASRIGNLAFDRADRSLWGLRTADGYVSLVRIPYPYNQWHLVHTFAYGIVPFSLSVSGDGNMLSMSVSKVDGSASLHIYKTHDLLAGKVTPIAHYSFGQAIPEGFVFTKGGRYLYGSSYYTGVSNIYRYDLATGKMDAVSNAATGFFRPMPLPHGKLAVLEYTGKGFLPVEIDPVPLDNLGAITFLGTLVAKRHPVVKTWGVGSPSKVPLKSMITSKGVYKPAHEMRLADHYPVFAGYRSGAAVGWHTQFADTLGLATLGIDAAVSVGGPTGDGQRYHLSVDYNVMNWEVRYWHNHASFYDLFGPTRTSLKGDSLLVGYHRTLIYDLPRRLDFSASTAYYTGLATLPGKQNVSSQANDRIFVTHAGLNYADLKSSGGAVDREQGIAWNVDGTVFVANHRTIPQLEAGFDFGFMLPVPHMSLWLYNSAGVSGGSRDNNLANFYFGGFQNNYVDHQDPKRYRQFDTFPGFKIDAIAGHTFAKSTLELNLPPVRFERVGSPGFFLKWMRPALFTSLLVTDPNHAELRRTTHDIGVQLDLEFVLFSRLPMTLSGGYARGFSGPDGHSDEWMLSLKIL